MTDDPGTRHLRIGREGSIAWCVIDRPAARNALTPAMYYGLKRAVRLVNTDPDLRALIIIGTGDVFAPGGDLGGRREEGEHDPDAYGHEVLPFLTVRDSNAPVISAVNGIPDATYAAVRPAHVGLALARDLLLTGRSVDAARAAAYLVLRTAPEARAQVERTLSERYGQIDYQTMFWALEHSPELREGMAAFMEKRPPAWVPADAPSHGPRLGSTLSIKESGQWT